jgi:ketosteroid isomerase-like protein
VDKGPAFPKGKTFDATKADAEAVKAALLEAERAFARTMADKGVLDADLATLADDALILREGAHPYRGKKEARAALSKEKSVTWENRGSGVSAAGDLGYTYGMARRGESSAAYMRVWEKGTDGSWKVVLDVCKLQEPPPAQKPAP